MAGRDVSTKGSFFLEVNPDLVNPFLPYMLGCEAIDGGSDHVEGIQTSLYFPLKDNFKTAKSSPDLSHFNECSLKLACDEIPIKAFYMGNLSCGQAPRYVHLKGFPDVFLPSIQTCLYDDCYETKGFMEFDINFYQVGEVMKIDERDKHVHGIFAFSPVTSRSGADPPQRQIPYSLEEGRAVIYIHVSRCYQASKHVTTHWFAVRAFPSKLPYVKVYSTRGRGVMMKLIWRQCRSNELILTHGWKDFLRSNQLRHGSAVKFSVLSTDETTMFINIITQ
ncbi:hypothetical protein PIB30_062377 [Stylosanthes scabra]|uniref:TF-B3 domain-containing protein n=1 Tax=Stylosanthes scabra TaxID=79078 RepID=A0ABU6VLA5_9FABA|nr:hypothetical protein [Stylosanthes scabra]